MTASARLMAHLLASLQAPLNDATRCAELLTRYRWKAREFSDCLPQIIEAARQIAAEKEAA